MPSQEEKDRLRQEILEATGQIIPLPSMDGRERATLTTIVDGQLLERWHRVRIGRYSSVSTNRLLHEIITEWVTAQEHAMEEKG